jgi:hypothetical protein
LQILFQHFPSPADGPVISALASRFGWSVLQADVIEVLDRACDINTLADCCKLLLRIAPKLPKISPTPHAEAGALSHADGNGVSRQVGVSAVETKCPKQREGHPQKGGKRPKSK